MNATVHIRVRHRRMWGLTLARPIIHAYGLTKWRWLMDLTNWCIRQTVIECSIGGKRWKVPPGRMPQLTAD